MSSPTFFEGTAKIHMLVLVPVKARNSIDITLTRETTKTRTATTPSNSLTFSFTDVVDSSSGDRYSNAGAAMKWREKLCGLETGFLKSPDMAGVGMPQVYGQEMTTGELARSASIVIGTVSRETTCCHVRGKIFAGKSHQTRA